MGKEEDAPFKVVEGDSADVAPDSRIDDDDVEVGADGVVKLGLAGG